MSFFGETGRLVRVRSNEEFDSVLDALRLIHLVEEGDDTLFFYLVRWFEPIRMKQMLTTLGVDQR